MTKSLLRDIEHARRWQHRYPIMWDIASGVLSDLASEMPESERLDLGVSIQRWPKCQYNCVQMRHPDRGSNACGSFIAKVGVDYFKLSDRSKNTFCTKEIDDTATVLRKCVREFDQRISTAEAFAHQELCDAITAAGLDVEVIDPTCEGEINDEEQLARCMSSYAAPCVFAITGADSATSNAGKTFGVFKASECQVLIDSHDRENGLLKATFAGCDADGDISRWIFRRLAPSLGVANRFEVSVAKMKPKPPSAGQVKLESLQERVTLKLLAAQAEVSEVFTVGDPDDAALEGGAADTAGSVSTPSEDGAPYATPEGAVMPEVDPASEADSTAAETHWHHAAAAAQAVGCMAAATEKQAAREVYEQAVHIFIEEYCTMGMTVSDMEELVRALLDIDGLDRRMFARVLKTAAKTWKREQEEKQNADREKKEAEAMKQKEARAFAALASSVLCLVIPPTLPCLRGNRTWGVCNQYLELIDACDVHLQEVAARPVADAADTLHVFSSIRDAAARSMEDYACTRRGLILAGKAFQRLTQSMGQQVECSASKPFLSVLQVVVEKLVRCKVKSWGVLADGSMVGLLHVHKESLCTRRRFDEAARRQILASMRSKRKQEAGQQAAEEIATEKANMLASLAYLSAPALEAPPSDAQREQEEHAQQAIARYVPNAAIKHMFGQVRAYQPVKEYLRVYWVHMVHALFTVAGSIAKAEQREIMPKDIAHGVVVETMSQAGMLDLARQTRLILGEAKALPSTVKPKRGAKRPRELLDGVGDDVRARLERMRVTELQKMLIDAGMAYTGRKAALIDRFLSGPQGCTCKWTKPSGKCNVGKTRKQYNLFLANFCKFSGALGRRNFSGREKVV